MAAGALIPFRYRWPRIAPDAFVAAGCQVIGDVTMGALSSLWFNCVARGDVNAIRIGARSNVQDGTIIHTATDDGPTVIGTDVVVGHLCMLHACRLEDGCLVGMGATVMDYAVVESGGWVAAGALVTPGKRVKSGELWMGRPARFERMLSNAERETIARLAQRYAARTREYRAMSGPPVRLEPPGRGPRGGANSRARAR